MQAEPELAFVSAFLSRRLLLSAQLFLPETFLGIDGCYLCLSWIDSWVICGRGSSPRNRCRRVAQVDWGMSGDTSLLEGKPGFALDFNFFVEDGTVVMDEADAREQQGWVHRFDNPVCL